MRDSVCTEEVVGASSLIGDQWGFVPSSTQTARSAWQFSENCDWSVVTTVISSVDKQERQFQRRTHSSIKIHYNIVPCLQDTSAEH